MKQLIHGFRDTSICIYEHKNNFIRGSFFNEKPEVGDIIMSHERRDVGFLYMYEVTKILENRDARVQENCSHNPEKALFVLEIQDVTKDERFSEVDNSMKALD